MSRPRTPLAKATVEGRTLKDPQRYRDRREPAQTPLGDAPQWFNEAQALAWDAFRRELPWLVESDRALLEVVTPIRALISSGAEIGLTRLGLYRLCLAQLGASPADRSKVTMPDNEEDPDDAFYN